MAEKYSTASARTATQTPKPQELPVSLDKNSGNKGASGEDFSVTKNLPSANFAVK